MRTLFALTGVLVPSIVFAEMAPPKPNAPCEQTMLAAIDAKAGKTQGVLRGERIVDCTQLTVGKNRLIGVATLPENVTRPDAVPKAKLFLLAKSKNAWSVKAKADIPPISAATGPYQLLVQSLATKKDAHLIYVKAGSYSDGESSFASISAWQVDEELTSLIDRQLETDSGSGYPKSLSSVALVDTMSPLGLGTDFFGIEESSTCEEEKENGSQDCRTTRDVFWLCASDDGWAYETASCWMASANASSELKSASPGTYGASNVGDRDDSTAWVEGKKGSPIGEWVRIDLRRATTIEAVHVTPGFAKSKSTWTQNNRVKRAKLIFSDGSETEANFSDEMKEQRIGLGGSKKITWLKLQIVECYKGSKYDDTAISGIIPQPAASNR
jgi:hypothetical protein